MTLPNYRTVAKRLGVRYLFGKWGFNLLPRDPSGRIYRLFTIVPLDGWITDPKEVERTMRERGMEL
jgi:hypothetical protein